MPPGQPDTSTGEELSLRHFPDTSDASFSFQMPNAFSKADLLLDDDDMSFFRNANDSLATPGPSRTASKALTLDELTPRPMRTHPGTLLRDEPDPSASLPVLDMSAKLKPKQLPRGIGKTLRPPLPTKEAKPRLQVMTQCSQAHADDTSSAATTLETLRAEARKLNNDLDEGPLVITPSNHTKPLHDVKPSAVEPKPKPTVAKPKRSQTVISGGISKPRRKNNSSTSAFLRHVPSVPKSQHCVVPPPPHVVSDSGDIVPDEQNPDVSICSTATGGVAERLVMYSEKLLSSLGPLAAENTSSPPTVNPEEPPQAKETISDPVNVNELGRGNNDPLTLSQISPCKPASPLPTFPANTRPPSPMRRSSKRPAFAASTERAPKKGKSAAAATDEQPVAASTAAQGTAGVRALEGSSSFSSKNARSTTRARGFLASKKSSRQVPSSTTTRRHVNASHAKVPLALARSEPSGSGPSAEAFSRSSSLVTSGSSVKRREEGISSTAKIANLPQGDKRVVLPPVINPTKPAEFKFHLDARMEARKAEYEKARSLLASQKPRKPSYQVPDFKTLHALHDAELALRKENIAPVIPLPRELNTEWRAREREKFDEHVREKERELEREREQKRREREELEEREIRELRKKAVPRAHEVPEWYKDAPRIQREKREVESNGD
ncbi:putative targeting protein for Xklp2 (TPX2) [Lyophyllum shimeji]|uniref:Targeting protein for Xklp2 (TPX2) n=1 Tax=Lyophyllum shimeji TaxID=47721 RepID=A0A9P3UXA6_LYOSH|nr:putative targeting protein for Xklp2 (TPX2) [Lyophyllum shimeji]